MSGGHFDYVQYRVDDAAESVQSIIKNYSETVTPQTLARLTEAAQTVERAAKMLQRIDWFVSGDDGEESFNQRWEEDGIDHIPDTGKEGGVMDKATFSVHEYDRDGDIYKDGIFLHFGKVKIEVAKNELEFDIFIRRLITMRKEIADNLCIDFEEFEK